MTRLSFTKSLASLRADRRGQAALETAILTPLLLVLGMGGIELANYSLVRMRVSQLTMNMADNASRVGLDTGLFTVQMTERDVNDTIAGANFGSQSLKLLQYGRVIISSLERNGTDGQWIHWQRCKGLKRFSSPYGAEGTGSSGNTFLGMGPANARTTAPSKTTAVMYVEVAYDYQPLFPFLWSDSDKGTAYGMLLNKNMLDIRYGNAFLVRDNRDLTRLFPRENPLTKTLEPQSLCTTYSAT